jgi:hypothetical protein
MMFGLQRRQEKADSSSKNRSMENRTSTAPAASCSGARKGCGQLRWE